MVPPIITSAWAPSRPLRRSVDVLGDPFFDDEQLVAGTFLQNLHVLALRRSELAALRRQARDLMECSLLRILRARLAMQRARQLLPVPV